MERANSGEYVIVPEFHAKLKDLQKAIDQVMHRIKVFKKSLEDDLAISIDLVSSNAHTFLFECRKKEGDGAFRRSKKRIKQVSIKNKRIGFTTSELTSLVIDYSDFMN